MSRVLLVIISLVGRSGTEIVCCETAHGLRKRNHDVSVYTQHDGPAADNLRADGFQVVTDLEALTSTPEVIQANQTYPLLEAVGRFPSVPAISICHDATVWYNEPIDLPSIRRHVVVDLACRARIVDRFVHLEKQVEILHNAVDLDRFQCRAPLPERPRRALILAKQANYLDAIRSACLQRGIDVDAFGPAVGNEIVDLSSRLGEYDLVFASARSALEAMAVGCAVIVVDGRGLAGLVTHNVVPSWHQNNFGLRLLSRPLSEETIAAEIDRYDPMDAGFVSDFIRKHSCLDRYLDRLEEMHRDVIREGTATTVDKDVLLYRMSQAYRSLATAQHAQMRAEFQQYASAREAAREAERQMEFQKYVSAREAAREAERQVEFQKYVSAREAERQTEFQAALQAYKDWTAPRNLGRRIKNKVQRLLSRT